MPEWESPARRQRGRRPSPGRSPQWQQVPRALCRCHPGNKRGANPAAEDLVRDVEFDPGQLEVASAPSSTVSWVSRGRGSIAKDTGRWVITGGCWVAISIRAAVKGTGAVRRSLRVTRSFFPNRRGEGNAQPAGTIGLAEKHLGGGEWAPLLVIVRSFHESRFDEVWCGRFQEQGRDGFRGARFDLNDSRLIAEGEAGTA